MKYMTEGMNIKKHIQGHMQFTAYWRQHNKEVHVSTTEGF